MLLKRWFRLFVAAGVIPLAILSFSCGDDDDDDSVDTEDDDDDMEQVLQCTALEVALGECSFSSKTTVIPCQGQVACSEYPAASYEKDFCSAANNCFACINGGCEPIWTGGPIQAGDGRGMMYVINTWTEQTAPRKECYVRVTVVYAKRTDGLQATCGMFAQGLEDLSSFNVITQLEKATNSGCGEKNMPIGLSFILPLDTEMLFISELLESSEMDALSEGGDVFYGRGCEEGVMVSSDDYQPGMNDQKGIDIEPLE